HVGEHEARRLVPIGRVPEDAEAATLATPAAGLTAEHLAVGVVLLRDVAVHTLLTARAGDPASVAFLADLHHPSDPVCIPLSGGGGGRSEHGPGHERCAERLLVHTGVIITGAVTG